MRMGTYYEVHASSRTSATDYAGLICPSLHPSQIYSGPAR